MTDNEACAREDQRKRANTLLLEVFEGDQAGFSAADVAHVVSALDAEYDCGRAAGLREAQNAILDVGVSFDTHGDRLLALAAVDTRLAALSADTPANRGEGI